MIVTCVHVRVKPGFIRNFIGATTENRLESIKESGNLRFDLLQQAADPERFMIYEAYVSEDAAAEHKLTSHYITWRDTVKDMMAEPREGVRYNIIEPAGKSEW